MYKLLRQKGITICTPGNTTSVMVALTPARSTHIGGTSSTPGPPVKTGLSFLLLKQLVRKVRLRGSVTPSRYGCTYSSLNERSSFRKKSQIVRIQKMEKVTLHNHVKNAQEDFTLNEDYLRIEEVASSY